jgi:2-polyprenyl-3-methyl-5-hydroxy-6-metoxy-1,4-benzoquinol methylase
MLISDEYRRLNADLHQRAVFGQRGERHAPVVRDIIPNILLANGRKHTVLDYGCGRATLSAALPGVQVVNYDPAIPEYAALPPPCDIVVCTDVLEHIEPNHLDAVLKHLRECTRFTAHIVIATKPDGGKKLADGRDPHLIVQPPEWWRERLASVYRTVRCMYVTARDCGFRCWL